MKSAISDFVQEVAEKLRSQKSVCKSIAIFLLTNRHRKGEKQYYNSINLELPYASNDNLTLQEIAFFGLEKIFRKGYKFKKAGVYVNDLFSEENLQYTLWDDTDKIFKRRKLSETIDQINSSLGKIHLGIQKPKDGKHRMNQNKKSPNYTTNINDILKIDID